MFEGIRKLSVGIILLGFGGYLLCIGEADTGQNLIHWGIAIAVGGNVLDHLIAMKNGKKKE